MLWSRGLRRMGSRGYTIKVRVQPQYEWFQFRHEILGSDGVFRMDHGDNLGVFEVNDRASIG